jgi:hypothetical protein
MTPNSGPHTYLVAKPDEIEAIGQHMVDGPHLYLASTAFLDIGKILKREADMGVDERGTNVYLAMGTGDHMADQTVNQSPRQPFKMLLSYHYYKNIDVAKLLARFPAAPMVFADSGAYSAHTQGAEVKIDEYAAWIKKWQKYITVYVNLDVIRNPEQTAANQRYLERQGLTPIPVFHTGTDMKVLDQLAEQYGYIALGGMVGVSGPTVLKWSATCFKRVENKDVVFHGFGQTRNDVIQSLPWFSVDSSSWGKAHRFGQLDCWTGRKFVKAQVGDRESIYKIAPYIRQYGGDPEDFADRARYHRSKIIPIAAASWRGFELFLRRKHGDIPLPARATHLHRHRLGEIVESQSDTGVHLYMADTGKVNFDPIADADHQQIINDSKETQ